MRRKEKEITYIAEIETIISKSLVCRLGLIDDKKPYVVPLCFGYCNRTVFLHSSLSGRKMDAIRKDPNVCLQFDIHTEVIPSDNACKWGMKFQSVIAFGRAEILDNDQEKIQALNTIMQHYSGRSYAFPDDTLKKTAVIKIKVESMTGKQSGL